MHRILSGALSVEHHTIKISGLPATLQGTKLVQLSDLHYDGLRLSEEMLADAIAATNAIEPDLVFLTGDYITDNPTPINKLVLRLKHLRSRLGIYAVLGNHDICWPGAKEQVQAALTSINIQVLWNQIAYPLGTELPIVGLADYWSRDFNPAQTMDQLNSATPRIVLAHNPDTAQVLQKWRVDLQLSGHTHGGQLIIPKYGPAVLMWKKLYRQTPRAVRRLVPFLRRDNYKVVRHWEWAQGFHQVGTNQLYVNRGLGTYLPGRLFCPPEVTVITLV